MKNRRDFLLSAAAAASASLLPAVTRAANAHAPMSAAQAFQSLLDGNERFAGGRPRARAAISAVTRLASGQTPFATVLGCADSRVPVETIFDRDPGDIFTVRIAGNFADAAAVASIEYATAVLKSPLIFVLGHSSCGAVKAAVDYVKSGTPLPGHMQMLADAIASAARETRGEPGDWVKNAIRRNVLDTVSALKNSSPVLQPEVASGHVEIRGGVYDLSTGRVTIL